MIPAQIPDIWHISSGACAMSGVCAMTMSGLTRIKRWSHPRKIWIFSGFPSPRQA